MTAATIAAASSSSLSSPASPVHTTSGSSHRQNHTHTNHHGKDNQVFQNEASAKLYDFKLLNANRLRLGLKLDTLYNNQKLNNSSDNLQDTDNSTNNDIANNLTASRSSTDSNSPTTSAFRPSIHLSSSTLSNFKPSRVLSIPISSLSKSHHKK
ncbi:unnamed protein product [[Candida] boidinii]|nr:unnamed protein product [[Candida] boidinii]